MQRLLAHRRDLTNCSFCPDGRPVAIRKRAFAPRRDKSSKPTSPTRPARGRPPSRVVATQIIMATATFNTVPAEPAEQTTLVAPKKTTVSWKGLVIGVVSVFVVAAASMTLYTSRPTTMEMIGDYKNCNMWGMKWKCIHAYGECVIDTSGNPKCAADWIRPTGPTGRGGHQTCHRGVLSWNCIKGAYEYCA